MLKARAVLDMDSTDAHQSSRRKTNTMPRPITIQIQLEPDLELDESQVMKCREAMFDSALKIESLGSVRCEIYVGQEAYHPKD